MILPQAVFASTMKRKRLQQGLPPKATQAASVGDEANLLEFTVQNSRARGGSIDYYQEVAMYQAGAANLAELVEWPKRLVSDLFNLGIEAGRDRMHRFRDVIDAGIICCTDYSGKGGPEMLFRMMSPSLGLKPFLHSYYACDISPTCRGVLLGRDDCPCHVFPELHSRLPPGAGDHLRGLEPASKADVPHASQAYRDMADFLESRKGEMFHSSSKSQCLSHPGQQCLVNPLSDSHFVKRVQGSSNIRPLVANIAGTSCTPWSPQGSRRGLGHEAMAPYYLWHIERTVRQEDIIGHENSQFFPTWLFTNGLSASHFIITLTTSPEDFGWPLRRRRKFSLALNRSSLIWVGPSTLQGIKEEFTNLFCRRVVLDGDVFICDTEQARAEYLNHWSRRRGTFLRKDSPIANFDMRMILRGFQLKSFDQYKKLYETQERFSRCFIADLSQNPDSHSVTSAFMPTQITHSCLYSFSATSAFTPSELILAHGWPCVPGTCDTTLMPFDFRRLTPSQQVHLSGNAMHLPTLAAFYFYVLSNCVRRDKPQTFDFLPPAGSEEDEVS